VKAERIFPKSVVQ